MTFMEPSILRGDAAIAAAVSRQHRRPSVRPFLGAGDLLMSLVGRSISSTGAASS